ncbi:hypothetical protein CAPTEDRAFT_101940 [Capitella teleta]|uniref:Sodium-coupled monocarboxylate transporter 1 n=1 Tax=Capitella teleta TaxID=283909 RepID=R7U0S6_CAPTE|nr:hypothetical protein CAPTEDRAFT_101940 [Capitella teleta]|eukprot:ELT97256.1 hypothetical protein CAPTEDRAFT_101940 [Capitella teleta]
MATTEATFGTVDYVVFILVLVGTSAIGVIQGIIGFIKQRNGKAKQAEEDDVGVKNLSIWPASLSIMASVSAAPFVLGIPAEIYAYGTMFSLLVFAYVALPFMSHILYERWYKMGITSMYEYLELRYNKILRSIATALFALALLIYSGVIVYAPALAFSQVSGVDINLCIVLVGVIGIVYTAVGGLKGVLWVDALQMLIILGSVIAIIAEGCSRVGGIAKVWEIADEGQRIQFDVVSADPRVRHTVFTQIIGGFFFVMVMFCNQAVLQKFLGLPSVTKMHVTAYISMAAVMLYFSLFCLSGLVIYAYYAGCDPILGERVSEGDQLVPLFVLEVFSDAYGFPGLFTAAVFGATLSSIAGAMNAMAAVTLLDVIQPLVKMINPEAKPDPKKTMLAFKALVVIYGILIVGIAFITPFMGSSVIELSLSIVGTLGAPIMALFLIGVIFPFVNSWGAGAGCLVSLIVCVWLNLGTVITGTKTAIRLPLDDTQCPSNVTATVQPLASEDRSPLDDFYEISYLWYSLLGCAITVVVAIGVSAVTGKQLII